MATTTSPDDNIFEALGFDGPEAANLEFRAQLMDAIEEIIDERGFNQKQAAEHFDVDQPRISQLRRKQVSKFTIDSLVNMLNYAGVDVRISVGEEAQPAPAIRFLHATESPRVVPQFDFHPTSTRFHRRRNRTGMQLLGPTLQLSNSRVDLTAPKETIH